ncbi:MAG: hypothetical protein DRJ69_02890 [Thermoprotei archaeon]|nr:MAG: hypothetical protein DRJ69_02890 [Thermoprotei archaeon]
MSEAYYYDIVVRHLRDCGLWSKVVRKFPPKAIMVAVRKILSALPPDMADGLDWGAMFEKLVDFESVDDFVHDVLREQRGVSLPEEEDIKALALPEILRMVEEAWAMAEELGPDVLREVRERLVERLDVEDELWELRRALEKREAELRRLRRKTKKLEDIIDILRNRVRRLERGEVKKEAEQGEESAFFQDLVLRDGCGRPVVNLSARPDLVKLLQKGDIQRFMKKLLREGAWRGIRSPPVRHRPEAPSRKKPRPRLHKKILLLVTMVGGPNCPLWVKCKRAY